MSENNQPITKTEFEAGVKFYHSPHSKKFDDLDTFHRTKQNYIEHQKHFYCSIQYIDDVGFSCIHFLFGQPNEFKVLFKNCLKSPNQ